MTSALKGEKHVVSKKPLHNSVNQQKLDNGCQPQEAKTMGRRRGRARGKAAERQVKLEAEAGLERVAPPVSSKGIVFCRRPGFGQEGTRSMNRAIIAELVRLYRETELGTRLPAYDGRKSLYTAGSLPFNSKEFIIRLVEDDDGLGVTRFY
ncbi:hypothetical protein BHE74_00016293 [Ensete ventricosum]|uniref:Uncharacterized protein n=1 Tax=Ensete ventricosum TaxID=4639 RepID=A0A427AZX2_ENSVE|nr:hypothetical protein B296_00002077 [Ensete ventricosum]RWV99522.1 hypothetical protein GW17_00037566 [Ensete ventricosum]RWW75657.1 hypothetical protein BHE74_00016293 [Ensete ventricosum]